jgi:hypothetical protein
VGGGEPTRCGRWRRCCQGRWGSGRSRSIAEGRRPTPSRPVCRSATPHPLQPSPNAGRCLHASTSMPPPSVSMPSRRYARARQPLPLRRPPPYWARGWIDGDRGRGPKGCRQRGGKETGTFSVNARREARPAATWLRARGPQPAKARAASALRALAHDQAYSL